MYNLSISKYISTPPRPEVQNFQIKINYSAGDRTPDLLNKRHHATSLLYQILWDEWETYFVDVPRT